MILAHLLFLCLSHVSNLKDVSGDVAILLSKPYYCATIDDRSTCRGIVVATSRLSV
jgi:hypothetical protein